MSAGKAATVAAVVAALVAALVTGGLFVAFDDDASNSSTGATGDAVQPASTQTLPALSNDNSDAAARIQALLTRVRPAVVRINITQGFQTGGGTGFVVGANGVIVTNAHVVESADTIEVTLDNGDKLPAKVKGVDVRRDLAVITVARKNMPTVALGDSDKAQVGETVIAIGNALDLEGDLSVTKGIVSAVGRQVDEENGNILVDVLQTDAAINPGNSGGPLLNMQGQVIGINTAIASPSTSNNIGFAIAISSAKPVISDLEAGRTPQTAYIGITSDDVTPELVSQFDLKVDHGAYVRGVADGTPAQSAGIKEGDVITKIDDQSVASRADLVRDVRRHRPGDRVVVTFDRDGTTKQVSVRLTSYPTSAQN